MRWSYLPPLMVYLAAGVSGLTAIVGTFFVKNHLGLSAEFLAALGFWLGIPYTIKMPIGHVVDLMWRWKGLLVYLGAALIAASLMIMVGLINHRPAMEAVMSVERWFILSSLLSPIGYSLTGEAFNLTMEELATHVAITLKAEKLIFVIEQRGVMLELEDHQIRQALVGFGGWTMTTAVCLMLFSLLHNPCSTTSVPG